MTGYTDNYGLPYPEADTLISESAPIVQELAEKIDIVMGNLTPEVPGLDYTVPGTLIATITTSGTWQPPSGIRLVHLAIIGGGGRGGPDDKWSGSGGAGGGVRIYRDVPVSGDIPVVIGGSDTGTTFHSILGSPPGANGTRGFYGMINPGPNVAQDMNGQIQVSFGGYEATGEAAGNGGAGPRINGVHYGGGGGGGTNSGDPGYGGPGGGGNAGGYRNGYVLPQTGTNGLGGGGGAGHQGGGSDAWPGALGGSGVVLVWTEQTTRDTPPEPTDPIVMVALDDTGVMVGAYAIDPVAPADTLGTLVPFPTEPVPTGQTWTDDETGETYQVESWPVTGWTYNDGEWSPPDD